MSNLSNRTQALQIVRRLVKEGFQALFAGGCVRDHLLGRPAKDYDVVTNAPPDRIISLFHKTLQIGARFGVILVILDNKQIEVATFRTEGSYQDGRHPGRVEFTSVEEDASRRDFTINGMFYDPLEKKVLDFVGGQKDLKRRILRTIGKPEERFAEDYLRLMRAVRFATQLAFEIEEKTWEAVKKYAGKIRDISAERVAMELEQILTDSNRERGVKLLVESGLIKAIFPQLQDEQANLGIHVLSCLSGKVNFALSMAALWTDVRIKQAIEWAKSFRLSNSMIKHIRFLLDNQGLLLNHDLSLARLKMLLAEPYWKDLVQLQTAIQKAHGLSQAALKKNLKRAREQEGKNLRPRPLLDGHELIALGAWPGPALGRLSREMYTAQLAEEIVTPEQARRWVRNWLSSQGKGVCKPTGN